VIDKWNLYFVQGNSITKFRDELKRLKADLKEWNKDVFGHLNTKKKRILKEIEVLNIQDDVSKLEDHRRLKRMHFIGQLRVINKKLEFIFRQKARTNWFVYGDSNFKFYHYVIK